MQPDKWIGQMRGIVQTLEQKSGLNPVLFVIALISLPSLFLYAFTDKWVFLLLIFAPLVFFGIIYAVAFVFDRDFLRSEKFIYDMKRLDVLGEKGKELPEQEILKVPATTSSVGTRKRLDRGQK